MKLLRGLGSPDLQTDTVAVIGNFDGVHRGHQALVAAVKEQAMQTGLPLLVIVFEPQTREYFLKSQSPPRLTPLRKKIQVLSKLGVDLVCCLRFNQPIAQMSATEFANNVIFSRLKVKHLFVGNDFRFGCDRKGDIGLLQTIAQSYHAQISIYPDVILNQQRISSTLVRKALQVGQLDEAEQLLGRPFSLCGRVIYGQAQGRQWGVPTANLKMSRRPLPLHGVFLVRVLLANGAVKQGVANIGCRPTVDGHKNLLEIHLFDFSDTLYGQWVEVFFLRKLRDERKFESKEALIAQIHADVASAKTYFIAE